MIQAAQFDARARRRHRGAMTLVELVMALTVLAVVSTAVVGLLHVGSLVNTSVTTSISNDTEVEGAVLRMVEYGRTATAWSVPSGTSLKLTTQPDASSGNATYDVTYALSGTQLQETQYLAGTTTARFTVATATVVRNVQSFAVSSSVNASGKTVLTVTLTVGTNPQAVRSFKIVPRNQ